MQPRLAVLSGTVLLVLACALTKLPNPSSAYGDYDDSEDDFWKDSAPKSQPKESVDPATGQRLVATTVRFFQARLKPDRRRTRDSTARLADKLNEIFLEEGMSHNKATAAATHVMRIQSRDEWDELKDAVFLLPAVYDVMSRQGLHGRPDVTVPYSTLWKATMGDDAPEPLFEHLTGQQAASSSTTAEHAAATGGGGVPAGKGKAKKKGGSKQSKGQQRKDGGAGGEDL